MAALILGFAAIDAGGLWLFASLLVLSLLAAFWSVADLIRTILHLSLANILLLGAIVVIRSFISFMMEYEMKALKND